MTETIRPAYVEIPLEQLSRQELLTACKDAQHLAMTKQDEVVSLRFKLHGLKPSRPNATPNCF